ncbi:MAG: twin-arginine translocase subunit TatC [Rickettsiales bacterium]|nr:MAG: twin-arginine translocase subunit TatC [Rickettsiales bacterium]
MQKYTFKEHLVELKNRLLKVVCAFIIAFGVSYWLKDDIYEIFLKPLSDLSSQGGRKIIYTGLAEAFFSYIKLALFSALFIILPVICYQIYGFISSGLKESEKKIVSSVLAFSPILFYFGAFFVFYFVMPRAWDFFLSYESSSMKIPLIMEARISEYLGLVMQLTLVFGMAFQLPIIMVILCVIGLVDSCGLRSKRRISIVIIFIVAAIFTPPDVISQIALAIPLMMLYETSIIMCKLVENRTEGSK